MNKIFLLMLGTVFMSSCKESGDTGTQGGVEETQEGYNYVTPPYAST
jgi:hypothetical protein